MDIDVLGRKLHVPQAAHGCARFTFAELCEKPLGPPDYLALAQNFRILFLEHIPALNPDRRNEAKRFVLLIDTLYDGKVRLVATSAQAPEAYLSGGRPCLRIRQDGLPPEGDAVGLLVGQKNRRNLTFWSSFSSERTRPRVLKVLDNGSTQTSLLHCKTT